MDDFGSGNRLRDGAVGLLVAAMALYGAVVILKAIWIPLCIIATVALGIGVSWWVVSRRINRW